MNRISKVTCLVGLMLHCYNWTFSQEIVQMWQSKLFIEAEQIDDNGFTLFDDNGSLICKNVSDFYHCGDKQHVMIKEFKKNQKGKWAIFSVQGIQKTKYQYDKVIGSSSFINHVKVMIGEKYALIDLKGSVVFSTKDKDKYEEYLTEFKKQHRIAEQYFMDMESDDNFNPNGPFVFQDSVSMKYGLELKDHKIVVEPKYDSIARTDKADYFIVCNSQKFGLITSTDRKILEIEYDSIDSMYQDMIVVVNNGLYGVCDLKSGKRLIESRYKKIRFKNK